MPPAGTARAAMPAVPAAGKPAYVAVDDNECVVCFDNGIDTIFRDCGHIALCHGCATQLDKCPICRAPRASLERLPTAEEQNQQQLEEDSMREAVQEGRGHRDVVGEREEWAARTGVNGREDTRRRCAAAGGARR